MPSMSCQDGRVVTPVRTFQIAVPVTLKPRRSCRILAANRGLVNGCPVSGSGTCWKSHSTLSAKLSAITSPATGACTCCHHPSHLQVYHAHPLFLFPMADVRHIIHNT